MGKWTCPVKLPFNTSLNRSEHYTWHHFPKLNSQPTKFSSMQDLVMRLPPFSLICTSRQRAFQFQSLPSLSKYCYMQTVQLGISSSFKINPIKFSWIMSCRLTRKYWSLWQGMQFLFQFNTEMVKMTVCKQRWATQQPPTSHKLVFSYFVYGHTAMWLKCVRTPPKCTIHAQFSNK